MDAVDYQLRPSALVLASGEMNSKRIILLSFRTFSFWCSWLSIAGAFTVTAASATFARAAETAIATPPAWCESQFISLMEDSKANPAASDKVRLWTALRPACGTTPLYQSRLGGLYVEAGDLGAARAAFKLGLKRKGSEKELQLGIADVDFRQGKLDESLTRAKQLITTNPQWWGGYSAVAQVQLVRHHFDDAIGNLEHANALQPSSGVYQLLAMAYYQQQRPRESALAMQKALKLDRSALRNTQAVCAAAYSLVQLGHVAEADELLKKHLLIRPEAAHNPTYKAATTLVARRSTEDTH
jgi:tetratricopeptide (TPR) repeat protein